MNAFVIEYTMLMNVLLLSLTGFIRGFPLGGREWIRDFHTPRIGGGKMRSTTLGLKKDKDRADRADRADRGFKHENDLTPGPLPKTENQKLYLQYLNDPSVGIVVGAGPAGSGKTFLACHTAIQQLRRGEIEHIIITRPLVPVDEETIGYLPGSLDNKMKPWTQPIMDIFADFYTSHEIKSLLATGKLELSPLAFMRGRTFHNSFVIADEMQNSSPAQMLMISTRLGSRSKMAIT